MTEIHPDDGQTLPVMGYFCLSEITRPSEPLVYKDLNFRFRPKRPLSEHCAEAAKAGSITV
ncbi:DUF2958 domain-containing protein [Microvirga tunisiensis]|uniref:DUF2958 domain-containing protein n=1 Tax=Microvirga tunisiensis TaxID=2108360 RepID=UPI00138689FA